MRESEVVRAQVVVGAMAAGLGLAVDEAVVVSRSNKVGLRLRPADLFARVAIEGEEEAEREVELALGLAAAGAPVVGIDPRVEPVVHRRDGFAVTFWTFHDAPRPVAPADHAAALVRLHAAMRTVDVEVPHMLDRVAEAELLLGRPDLTPALAAADRAAVVGALDEARRAVVAPGAPEQLIHGEPHPGNVLATASGPLFIDLETCCRGPVELDVAHAPAAVADHVPGLDPALLAECRKLVLAMVAAWRWDATDALPDGRRFGRALVAALRAGPPWPSLDVVVAGLNSAE